MHEKKTDYLVLVNEDNRLPEGYEDTVELLSIQNAAGEPCRIERKTYEAFLRLQEDLLQNDGIQLGLTSIYRTVPQQIAIFEKYRAQFGLDYANRYVAKPGHSEHHTGIAIDVGIILDGQLHRTIEQLLCLESQFRIIHEKLPRYGFILRYPDGKKPQTGIGYEPWHFRYVDDPQIAREIKDRGLCFEEYCQEKMAEK